MKITIKKYICFVVLTLTIGWAISAGFSFNNCLASEGSKVQEDTKKPLRCLVLDNGGRDRGINKIPALYQLAALAFITKKQIHELFDVVVGEEEAALLTHINTEESPDGRVLTAAEVLKIFVLYPHLIYKPEKNSLGIPTGLYDVGNLNKKYELLVGKSRFSS